MIPAVDCCNPDHWFDSRVGWPGKHDGGLPEFEDQSPCWPFGEPVPTVCPECHGHYGGKMPGHVYGSNWDWVPCQTCGGSGWT